jgi:hypothetical protein
VFLRSTSLNVTCHPTFIGSDNCFLVLVRKTSLHFLVIWKIGCCYSQGAILMTYLCVICPEFKLIFTYTRMYTCLFL